MREKSFQISPDLDLSSFSDQPSPIADLEHPFALSLSIEKMKQPYVLFSPEESSYHRVYSESPVRRASVRSITAGLALIIINACTHRAVVNRVEVNEEVAKSIHQPTAEQRALGIYQPFSDADIAFMTGMIPHHAQAVIMAGWAPSHGARSDLAILCERMIVGQADEIRSMQQWLSERGLAVPDATSTRMKMMMSGVEHDMLMPGMLSDEEMAELDKARGPEFDRLFLLGMVKHHQGAIDMVNDLFKAYGAAQDDTLYKFASDVFADQSIEIEVMRKMLATVQ